MSVFKKYWFIWLCQVLVVTCGILLCHVQSFAVVHGPSSCDSLAPEHTGAVVVAHGLSCSTACGVLAPCPGIEPTSSALQGGFLPTGPPGKSRKCLFKLIAHFKNWWGVLSFSCWLVRIYYIFWIQVPYQIYNLQLVFPILWVVSLPSWGYPLKQKCF